VTVLDGLSPARDSSVKWVHVQRMIDEENERLARARTGVRLARVEAARVTNIVLSLVRRRW